MIFDALFEAAAKTIALGDWSEPGVALANVVEATEALVGNGAFGPFAVVLPQSDVARFDLEVTRGCPQSCWRADRGSTSCSCS